MSSMQPMRPHHVYIVDDSAPIRMRLTEMLCSLETVKLVGEAATAPRATRVSALTTHCTMCNLSEMCLPCGVDAADLQRQGELVYTRKRVKRGEKLFRAGTAFDSLYAVRAGFFKTSVVLEDGRD